MHAEGPRQCWRLEPADLRGWLADLLHEGRRVVAPVAEDGLRRFRPLGAPEEACLEPGKTRWSPKEFLFPRTETLFRYRRRAGTLELEDPPDDGPDQVLFGVRPCDAAGLLRLDAVFFTGEADPAYARRRQRTTVVSLACTAADPECFCAAVGGGPGAPEGSDAQLLPLGEGWLLATWTARGDALTGSLAGRAPSATEEEWRAARAQVARLEQRLEAGAIPAGWAAKLEAAFHLPLWEIVGQRCLGCAICTMVCPSCSCFDVNDRGTLQCGERCRSWDSCTFALFTRHASGHNPRPTQPARYRQRVLHKFAYFPLLHQGRLMCVGCGRCLRLCPVGLDVREAVRQVAAAAEEARHDAG